MESYDSHILVDTIRRLRESVQGDRGFSAVYRECDSFVDGWYARWLACGGPGKYARQNLQLTNYGDLNSRKTHEFFKPFFVGRHPAADLNQFHVEDTSLSRLHAFVWHDGSSWWVADLDSQNGTFYNGARLGAEPIGPLRKRDLIQFANKAYSVSFSAENSGDKDETIDPQERGVVPASAVPGWPHAELIVGAPRRHRQLTVFPLLCDHVSTVDYVLTDEVIGTWLLTIEEISHAGEVSRLLVNNRGSTRILMLEGEVLRGNKQTRTLNTSVLVRANSALIVPVSCVEQGRWRHEQNHPGPGPQTTPSQVRFTLKESVARSLQTSQTHDSNQGRIWHDVQSIQNTIGATSNTSSICDTMDLYESQVDEASRDLPYIAGACGMAVSLGSRIISVDLFDKPTTCAKVWKRLLWGLLMDEACANATGPRPTINAVVQFLTQAQSAAWVEHPAVGAGQEFRTEYHGTFASALVLDGTLLHGSITGPTNAA